MGGPLWGTKVFRVAKVGPLWGTKAFRVATFFLRVVLFGVPKPLG